MSKNLIFVLFFSFVATFYTMAPASENNAPNRNDVKSLQKQMESEVYYNVPSLLFAETYFEYGFGTQLERRHIEFELQLGVAKVSELDPKEKDAVVKNGINIAGLEKNIEEMTLQMSLDDIKANFKIIRDLSNVHLQYLKEGEKFFKGDDGYKYCIAQAINIEVLSALIVERLEKTKNISELKKDLNFKKMLKTLCANCAYRFMTIDFFRIRNDDPQILGRLLEFSLKLGILSGDVYLSLYSIDNSYDIAPEENVIFYNIYKSKKEVTELRKEMNAKNRK